MNRIRLWGPASAAALVLICAVLAGGPGAPRHADVLVGAGSSWANAAVAAGATHSVAPAAAPAAGHPEGFSIGGSVTGLYPGSTLPLRLTVSNPDTVAITVTELDTTVERPTGTCLARYLVVSSWRGQLHLAPSHSREVTVEATMAHESPNSCQGARFPLRYSGTANVP